MALTTFKRYEKKYLITENQFQILNDHIENYLVSDKFNESGDPYKIYNIYFDTPDNQIIRHSLSKPYYKEKLRLRSYGRIKNDEEMVFLELKKKIGGIVCKRRAILSLKEATEFLENNRMPESSEYINNQVLKEINHFLNMHSVSPKVFISYDRFAWFGKEDKDFRLTFDKNIFTRRFDIDLKHGASGNPLISNKEYLLEIKTSGAYPLWLAELLSTEKIFPQSFSKYGREFQNFSTSRISREVKQYA